jgi:4-amino-4-deoxy-L-arabinose transferase-like glycosyltransferase
MKSPPWTLYWILALIVFSLVINGVFLHKDQVLPSDGCVYSQIGKNLAEGKGFTYNGQPNFLWPPLTSMMLGGIYYLFGSSDFEGFGLAMLFSALCIIPLFLIAKKYFSTRTAVLSCLLFIFSQQVISTSTTILSDIPALFFFLMFFYYFVEEQYHWSAIFLGLMALTRRTALIVFVIALIWLCLKKYKFTQHKIITVGTFIGLVVMLTLPYFAWTYQQTGSPFYSEQEGLTVPITNSVTYETKAITGTLPTAVDYSLVNLFYLTKKFSFNFFGIFLWLIPSVLGALLLIPLIYYLIKKHTNEYTRYSAAFIAGFILLFTFSMATQRYMLVFLPLLLIMAAEGVFLIFDKLQIRYVWLILILLIYLTPTVFTWAFYEPEHKEWREAGEWMAANLPKDSKILARKPQIPYYAGMEWDMIPMDLNATSVKGYDYIVFDESYTAVYRPNLIDLMDERYIGGLELVYHNPTPMQRVKIWRINEKNITG